MRFLPLAAVPATVMSRTSVEPDDTVRVLLMSPPSPMSKYTSPSPISAASLIVPPRWSPFQSYVPAGTWTSLPLCQ